MTRSSLENPEFLLQLDVIEKSLPKIGREQWQTLYRHEEGPSHRMTIWCALLDERAATRAMTHEGWDLNIGGGKPGFSQSWCDAKEVTTYNRFGGCEGVRALILHRSFSGAFPPYAEVDEEFRLYHDLAEDKMGGLLLSFDESGREIEVVRIRPEGIRAQLKYLKRYQAGTGLHLAIYIDSVRYSQIPLTKIQPEEILRTANDERCRWQRRVAAWDLGEQHQTFSRLVAKVLLAPPDRDKAGVWPFNNSEYQRAVGFIVGVDEDGNGKEHTSDPDLLDNNFGANPGAPHYLTPVYFRREVLAKYFAEPERYNVLDGQLYCLSIWSCQIDNDLDSHVVVFLGDLGRDLPYHERLHWRQFNVPPEGGLSDTNIRRSFLAQFADGKADDLTFRREYTNIVREWEKAHEWSLFLPPSSGDAHLLNSVRIPVTNAQSEFDEQVGNLTKLLVDSLNERELAARAGVLENGAKGIQKLSGFLENTGFPDRQALLQFLRNLQNLRSTGSAHRKGSAYKRVIEKMGVDSSRKLDTVRTLLKGATGAIRALREHYCKEREEPG